MEGWKCLCPFGLFLEASLQNQMKLMVSRHRRSCSVLTLEGFGIKKTSATPGRGLAILSLTALFLSRYKDIKIQAPAGEVLYVVTVTSK